MLGFGMVFWPGVSSVIDSYAAGWLRLIIVSNIGRVAQEVPKTDFINHVS